MGENANSRIGLLLLVLCSLAAVRAQPVADVVVFDEDDPLGRDYYDASIGFARGGSSLKLLASSRDKMPVGTNSAAVSRFSGVLRWTSTAGGDWQMHIFAPGFPLLNLSGHQNIVIALNGPSGFGAEDLPRIALTDIRSKTISAALGEFVAGGVDSDPATWQRVAIPLSRLRGERGFDFGQVKHVTLAQGGADGVAHELWIDDLRVQSSNRLVPNAPPGPVSGLVGRAGDRSVTVHWNPSAEAQVQRYRVFRRDTAAEERAWSELPQSPVLTPSVADVSAENERSYEYIVRAENELGLGEPSGHVTLTPKAFQSDDEFLEYVQGTAFDFFWFEANPANGMIRDRTQPWSAASIASIGFGLSAIPIGIEHRWISREAGVERVKRTLETLWRTPQGEGTSGTSGYKGWFYHFLNFQDATRFGTSELSSIDTALLLAGMLDAAEYFDGSDSMEREIRSLAKNIFARVDWKWMLNRGETLAMGWYPEQGFTRARWNGYNEASILYLLGLGAEKNSLEAKHWRAWAETYSWDTSYGYSFIHFPPLFGHQYSACWIDFRGIVDDYTAGKGITYFENSRRATLAQREYCIANPGNFPGYGPEIWGLTACDGPGANGTHAYIARGAPPPENDDGTIAPTAAGGSLPFTPEHSIRALRTMYDRYREKIWCGYGFRDAFNLKEDWWGADVIGIDQGAILLMAENLRTDSVWNRMSKNPVLKRGLERAGFRPLSRETRSGN